MVAVYPDKNIDTSKLGCFLANLASSFLHKSAETNFYPFTEAIKDMLERIRKDVGGGRFIVFSRKSTNICISIEVIDASQLYPYSKSQSMSTGLYTRWDLGPQTRKFGARQNKTRIFENTVMSFLQRTRPLCEIKASIQHGDGRKLTASVLKVVVLIGTLCSEQWAALITFVFH